MSASLFDRIAQQDISPGKLGLWPLGGGSVAVKSHTAMALADPFFSDWSSERWKRRFPPIILPDEIHSCDLVLITHEHEDHCDPNTVRPLLAMNHNVVLVGPAPSIDRLRRNGVFDGRTDLQIIEATSGQDFSIADLSITVVRTYDPLSQGPVGYLVRSSQGSILFMGDSLFDEELLTSLASQHRPDVFVVALGNNPPGEQYYYSVSEVVEAARVVYPSYILPIHWDLWTKTYVNPKKHITTEIPNLLLTDRGEFVSVPKNRRSQNTAGEE